MNDLPESETILYGVKEGNEDWQEAILSTCPENFDDIKVMATRDGFGRFRIAKVDLTAPLDFARTVNPVSPRKGKADSAKRAIGIAEKILGLSDAFVRISRIPSKEDARAILRAAGYPESKIQEIEKGKK